jgi:hypothetical protein
MGLLRPWATPSVEDRATRLATRRDNLKETIAALEKWLAGLQDLTEQVAA